jgi:hypothetical protein
MKNPKPHTTLVSGSQFQGFLTSSAAGVNTPSRTGEGTEPRPGMSKRDHRNIIATELNNHPKKIGMSMFVAGLTHMGVEPNEANLDQISGLIRNDNDQFHKLVGLARKTAIGAKQRMVQKNRGTQR